MRKLVNSYSSIWLIAVLVAVIVIASCGSQSDDSGAPEGLPPEFDTLAEVWEVLQESHFDRAELEPVELNRGAIRGLLEALDDPYAAYLAPDEYSIQSEDISGSFSGIGASVAMREGRIIVLAPLPGTPAEAAGIRPGDSILAIDGESTDGLALLEAVVRIRGPRGEPVELLILHEDAEEPVTITIVRDDIEVTSVKFEALEGGIGHLTVSAFTETTEAEVIEALQANQSQGNWGLVLDLRNNPGGLLEATVRVASQFLNDGLVLYQIDADGERRDWEVQPGGLATDIPMVVLINQFSASGSEVLLGALMDHQRATSLGVTSFGKGSVNVLHELEDGSGIYFTVARWYTPEGTLIEGEGLEPGIVIELPEDFTGVPDIMLERAIQTLKAETGRS